MGMGSRDILYVIDGIEYGGGERVFLQLISGLRDKFRIIVSTTPGGEFESKVRDKGVSVLSVDMRSRLSLKPAFKISSVIKNAGISLVHSQGARADFYSRLATRLARKAKNICTVAMPVEGFDVSAGIKMVYRVFDKMSERYVDKYIAVSDALKRSLTEKQGIPSERIARIYNGIELSQYLPGKNGQILRKDLGILADAPVIGAIGRMVWQKGFEFFLRAVPDVVRALPNAKILLVGDGPLRNSLEALSKEHIGKKNVLFVGFWRDIKEILSIVDLVVAPSIREGFPMVTLEAMAMAKPVIASNIDGITEQISNGVNGLLVPAKAPKAIADAIIKLLNDKAYAKEIGLAARNSVVQKYSVEKMIAETEKVYLSLLNLKVA